jgi:hypothetical protein
MLLRGSVKLTSFYDLIMSVSVYIWQLKAVEVNTLDVFYMIIVSDTVHLGGGVADEDQDAQCC